MASKLGRLNFPIPRFLASSGTRASYGNMTIGLSSRVLRWLMELQYLKSAAENLRQVGNHGRIRTPQTATKERHFTPPHGFTHLRSWGPPKKLPSGCRSWRPPRAAPDKLSHCDLQPALATDLSADPLPARGRRWGSVRLALERDCGSLLPSLSPLPVQPCTLPAFFLSLFSCSSSFLFFPFPFCCRRTPLVGARCGHTSAAWKSAGSEAFLAGRSL